MASFITFLKETTGINEINQIEAKLPDTTLTFHNTVKAFMKTKQKEPELLQLLPSIYRLYVVYYPTLSTRTVKLSEIRKIIKEHQSEDVFKKSKYSQYFNITQEESKGMKDKYNKQLSEHNNNKFQINKDDLLTKIRDLIVIQSKQNTYDLWLLLLLVGGMRPHEAFTNIVKPVKGKPAYISISNLAKKRNDPEFSVERPIILLTGREFITKLKRLREAFKDKVSITAEGKLSSDKQAQLNKRVLMYFPEFKEIRQSSSMLRKIYATLAFEIYGDKSKQNFNSFITATLGHDGAETSFSYSYINLETEQKDMAQDIKDELKQIRKDEKKEVKEAKEALNQPKLSRKAPKDQKIIVLEELYKHNTAITNTKLRVLSGYGSRIINEFLTTKRNL